MTFGNLLRLPFAASGLILSGGVLAVACGSEGARADSGTGANSGTEGSGASSNGNEGIDASDGSGATGSGGATTGSGGNPAGASACWKGAFKTWTATDYASRKWARWPIPNSPASGLARPMTYSEETEGIRDEVTGLLWQKETSPTGSSWTDALEYCSSLGQGWTLPTRIELTTIVQHDKSGAKVDENVFTFAASAGWTWTSTPWVVNERKDLTGASALSWFVNFATGDSNNSLSQTNESGRSRCVKIQDEISLPADHYTVSESEVHDNYTCLIWQRGHSASLPSLTRSEAVDYCANLSLNGESWRLPALNELASIVDDVPEGDVSPAVDHEAFPETSPDAPYWTASAYGPLDTATTFWTLNFEDGYTQHPAASELGIARCVQ